MKLCTYCNKNKPVNPGAKYCSVCYRNEIKKTSVCERCEKNRVTISGLCLPCYNYKTCGYRVEAFKKYEPKCVNKKCPMVNVPKIMLDVDHIDNDRSNNKIANLQILCVWCHALKTRKVIPNPELDKFYYL